MPDIESLITAAEAKARELQEAIAALNAATQEAYGFQSEWLKKHTAELLPVIARTRRDVAMAARPKGPPVVLSRTSYPRHEQRIVEAVRRTKTIVHVRTTWMGERTFAVDSGFPYGPKADRCPWRIMEPCLDRIRAMPVGENDVSRALKAAEAVK